MPFSYLMNTSMTYTRRVVQVELQDTDKEVIVGAMLLCCRNYFQHFFSEVPHVGARAG